MLRKKGNVYRVSDGNGRMSMAGERYKYLAEIRERLVLMFISFLC